MNNRWTLVIAVLTLIVIGSAAALVIVPAPKAPTDTATSTIATSTTTGDVQEVSVTLSSTTATVIGKARGSWYFEASFPVKIINAGGTVVAQGPAQAQSDWMTTDFVPFKITLTFAKQPAGSHGTLVLKNDNPSGDPARDISVTIPVLFN